MVTLTVAAILGTVGLTMNPDSLDAAAWSAVPSVHAVAPAPESKAATEMRPAARPNADASAKATRRDAAH